MKKIILLSTFYFLLSVASASAALVPCGGSGQEPCQFCDLFKLVKNVLDFGVKIAIPIAVIAIVYGGIMILTAGASPERAKQGKDIVTAAIIGLVIVLLAWLILDTLIKLIAKGEFGPWNQLKC